MNRKNNSGSVAEGITPDDSRQTVEQHYESYEDIVSRELQPMKYQECNNGIDMDEFWNSRRDISSRQTPAQTSVQHPAYESPQMSDSTEKHQEEQAQKAENSHRKKVNTKQRRAEQPAPGNTNPAKKTARNNTYTAWAEHQPAASGTRTKPKTAQNVSQPHKAYSPEHKAYSPEHSATPTEHKGDSRIFYKECRIAGTYYHIIPELWEFYEAGDEVVLVRDKGNTHDENAVAVVLREDYEAGKFAMEDIMGFIPKAENTEIARFLDTFGTKALYSEIKRVTGTDPSNGDIYINIFYVV